MRRRSLLWAAVIAATAALGPNRADAGLMLALDGTGSFGPTSTLGGVAFGADTPYAYHAVFDATTDFFPATGFGLFPIAEFTIVISGHGTFTGIPNVDLNALLFDARTGSNGAGLSDAAFAFGFYDVYATATPPFDADGPTPSILSDYLGTVSGFPYAIPLQGGGEVVFKDFGSGTPTAALVPVPEPSALVLSGIGGLTILGFARRRRRAR